MSKYFSSGVLEEIVSSIDEIKEIRNKIYLKYDIDILDNDSISLATFSQIIKKIDSNYNCNFNRVGEDGHTIIDDKRIEIESKTRKTKKNKKNEYLKVSFTFHAKGLINHETYIFNVWDKETLTPIRCYYVKDINNVNIINNKLRKMSKNWSKKPLTRAGNDIISLKEDILIHMTQQKESKEINGCKVFML